MKNKIIKHGLVFGFALLLILFSACDIDSPYLEAIQEKIHEDIGTYSVIYDGNSNDGGTVPVDENYYLEGWTVTAAENSGSLVKAGFTFVGWNTAADGSSGTDHAPGAGFEMGAEDLILYANWTQDPTYTVIYDGNGNTGGTVPIDGNNYEAGMTVTTKGDTGGLLKNNFIYKRWNTKADGTGLSYSAGDTFAIGNADVILYAEWDPTYTISYEGNGNTGGTVPIDGNNYEAGTAVTVKGDTGGLLKTNYIFTRWNTKADGTGSAYSSDDVFSIGNEDVILYVEWDPTYSITYDGNNHTGGDVPTDSNRYESGEAVLILGNIGNLENTTDSGYNFNGWNTASNGSGTNYQGGSSFDIDDSNITLFANWTANPVYSVTYDGNNNTGGNVPTGVNHYLEGTEVTVLENINDLIRDGFNFKGWNTRDDGNGTPYDATGTDTFFMGTVAVTLYARWNPTYTVTYDGNDSTAGSVPLDSNRYEQGTQVTVQEDSGGLSKSGYIFTGWNTAANGSGTPHDDTGTDFFIMGTTAVTLYAQWDLDIAFSIKGGAPYANASEKGDLELNSSTAAANPAQMRFRDNFGGGDISGTTWGGWTVYSGTYSYGLSNGTYDTDGELLTVQVEYEDEYGNTKVHQDTITIDTVIPNFASFSIVDPEGNGDGFAESRNIQFGTSFAADVSEIMLSEAAGFSGAIWENSSSPSFELSSGEVQKTVYAKVRDHAGNESAGSMDDSIIYDIGPPVIEHFILKCPHTGNTDDLKVYTDYSVSIDLWVTDGAGLEQFRIEDDLGKSTAWVTDTSYLNNGTNYNEFNITGNAGTRTLTLEVEDIHGRSSTITDSIDEWYFIDIVLDEIYVSNDGDTNWLGIQDLVYGDGDMFWYFEASQSEEVYSSLDQTNPIGRQSGETIDVSYWDGIGHPTLDPGGIVTEDCQLTTLSFAGQLGDYDGGSNWSASGEINTYVNIPTNSSPNNCPGLGIPAGDTGSVVAGTFSVTITVRNPKQ